jgi:antitoxin HicB
MRYPVTLTRDDNDTFLVTFPDVPGAVTYGQTVAEALARAPEALATVFEALIKDRREIPPPSRITKHSVEVPALVTAKVCLYDTMRTAKVGKAELARRLDWHLPQVDRVLNVKHSSQLDQLESAFAALGKRLTVEVTDLPPTVHGAVVERARARGRAPVRRIASKKR